MRVEFIGGPKDGGWEDISEPLPVELYLAIPEPFDYNTMLQELKSPEQIQPLGWRQIKYRLTRKLFYITEAGPFGQPGDIIDTGHKFYEWIPGQ